MANFSADEYFLDIVNFSNWNRQNKNMLYRVPRSR